MNSTWKLLAQTYREWADDGGPRLGAALAYYTVFALAPLLILVMAVAAFFLGADAVHGQVFAELAGVLGPERAQFIERMLVATAKSERGFFAGLVATIVLFAGATGFFAQLQDALDVIWNVKSDGKAGWMRTILRYWWSLTMVFGTGFLLLVSLIGSTILSSVTAYASEHLLAAGLFVEIGHYLFSLGLFYFAFGLIFKNVPHVEIAWHDVRFGALVTAIFLAFGKVALGWYLGREGTTSAYGAAGTLVAVMVWSYYTAQILLFGAELTQVVARTRHLEVRPAAGFTFANTIRAEAKEKVRSIHSAKRVAT